MCQSDTVRSTQAEACATKIAWRLAAWALSLSSLALAQSPDWRKIGSSSVEVGLASPATGPVDRVWFSPDGDRLFARTHAGKIFETSDFETWSAPAQPAPQAEMAVNADVQRLPENGARAYANALTGQRVYALGKHLYGSEDGGRTWINLTGYNDESVIGSGQRDLAVSPRDPQQLVVANELGAWRSLDGGLSWSGLNLRLPNLAIRRILTTPRSGAALKIRVEGMGTLELPPGGGSARESWLPLAENDPDDALKRKLSSALSAEIRAVAAGGDTLYAGSSDGRLWSSADRGATWNAPQSAAGAIESIFVDPETPRVALATVAGKGPRVLRTANAGLFWDDATGNLPDAPARAVTADRAAGAVYVATDRGVFYGRTDLNVAGASAISWTAIADNLPGAAVRDVKLNASGSQLYIAVDGFGIYAAQAPHRTQMLRLVNAADLTQRAAAPGSLLSVLGGRILSAHAANLDFPVLASSSADSQIQVPFEITGSQISLSMEADTGTVVFGLPVKNVSPAIFVDRDGAAMVVDADTGLMLDARNTAHSRARIQVFATGMGKTRPTWPTGLAAPVENPPAVAAAVHAFLDGAPVEVTRAMLAPGYVGLYLIELQLPALVNSGPAELSLSADGQESNKVRIYMEAAQ